ncbi:hypothetical protein L9F63_008287 [Diploptera punctata]|uniref:Uncharacterized protein n=1 Tax=Diploptera punctata TaxID=6984 RepID=A0AAD7Z606_DIPPU|nr:hypothetical protein L9F63_008287 [Diploptera punctata]
MLPYQAVAMDYAVTSSFQRQTPAGTAAAAAALNMNPAFTHSWFVPADLCVPYKQNQSPLLEPGHVYHFYYYHYYLLEISPTFSQPSRLC